MKKLIQNNIIALLMVITAFLIGAKSNTTQPIQKWEYAFLFNFSAINFVVDETENVTKNVTKGKTSMYLFKTLSLNLKEDSFFELINKINPSIKDLGDKSEYDLFNFIDDLGNLGWEMTATDSTINQDKFSKKGISYMTSEQFNYYYFKRPIQ